jgi:hypothetical protein
MSINTEYFGNSTPAPGFARGGQAVDDEILYSAHNYVQKGVTLKPGQGVLIGGTFLVKDPASKKYVKATDPSTAVGILRKTTDTGTTEDAQQWQANILYAGLVKLAAVQKANSGVTLTNVLSGTVNDDEGYFKF